MPRPDIALQEFIGQLRVNVRAEEAAGHRPEAAFANLCVAYLSEQGILEDALICPYRARLGRSLLQLDGYWFDEDQGLLDLLLVDYRGEDPPRPLVSKDVVPQLQRVTQLFKHLMLDKLPPPKDNPDAAAMLAHIRAQQENIAQIRVFFLTDCPGNLQKIEFQSSQDTRAIIHIWDAQRLYQQVAARRPYASIAIDLPSYFSQPVYCLPAPSPCEEYQVYLAVFPGAVLAALYDEFGNSLLELNVRSFLQARGAVNKGIRATLREEPGLFMAYNNGLSATAEDIQIGELDGRAVLQSLRGLQIVNGGQTLASLYQALHKDKQSLSEVYVQAKICVFHGDALDRYAPALARYANTQNKVDEADFSSSDAFHTRLQRLSQSLPAPNGTRWFYERIRGQYAVEKNLQGRNKKSRDAFNTQTPAAQKFTKQEVARYENAWAGEPYWVARGAQKSFAACMSRLRKTYGEEWTPDEAYYRDLIGKAILFKAIECTLQQQGVTSPQAAVAAYCLALLQERESLELAAIWELQALPDAFNAKLAEHCSRVYQQLSASANGRNLSEWCKQDACWRQANTAAHPPTDLTATNQR